LETDHGSVSRFELVEDVMELALDLLLERKRIEGGQSDLELSFGLSRDLRGNQEALAGSFGFGILADDLGANPFFADQLEGGAEEIEEAVPGAVEGIHGWDQLRLINAMVA
jgi:hypothetical protein